MNAEGVEHYQIYHRFEEAVLPLPPGEGIAFLEAFEPGALPYSGFACVSPSDSSSETPAVPRFLPRPLPVGTYQWGVYASADDLYVIVDAVDGPPIPGIVESQSLAQLLIFQPDGLVYWAFEVLLDGRSRVRLSHYHHGPRKGAEWNEPEWNWTVQRHVDGRKSERTVWRIGRRALDPFIRNGVLRASISRSNPQTLEGVAWGAYGIWGPRFDECGLFRFEGDPAAALIPTLETINFAYDSLSSTGSLNLRWEGGYDAEEFVSQGPFEKWRGEDWSRFAVRVNGPLQMLPFASEISTAPFSLKSGLNEIHIASRGATHTRLLLEISSDREIVLPEYEGKFDCPGLIQSLHTEIARFMAEYPAPPPIFKRWIGFYGNSVAAFCERADVDASWLEWTRKIGDFTLSLQRPDGTFSGCHLSETGVSDVHWRGGGYDSGNIGEFWVRCHRLTGDDRYLLASERLMEAYRQYRIEFNHNYGAFPIFHLSAHWRTTRDSRALEHMTYYLQNCVMRHLLPLGFQGGHNYYTVYASILLRAMALAAVDLPKDHELSERLHRLVRRMTNQTLTRMQPSGVFDARDRYYVGETLVPQGLFDAALVLDGLDRMRLDGALGYVLKAHLERPPASFPNTLCTPSLIEYLYTPSL